VSLARSGRAVGRGELLVDDLAGQFDALVADGYSVGPGYQRGNLILRLLAERAAEDLAWARARGLHTHAGNGSAAMVRA
jgi:hypothetical protein